MLKTEKSQAEVTATEKKYEIGIHRFTDNVVLVQVLSYNPKDVLNDVLIAAVKLYSHNMNRVCETTRIFFKNKNRFNLISTNESYSLVRFSSSNNEIIKELFRKYANHYFIA